MLKDPTANLFSLLSDDAPVVKQEPKKKEPETKRTTPNNVRNVDNDSKTTNKVAPAPKKNNGVQPQRKNDSREDETIQVKKTTEKKDSRTRYKNINFNKRGRVYDRHSGTGRPPTENKKGGAGRRNWGKLNDDVEISQEVVKTEDEVVEQNETPKEEVKEPEPEYTTLVQFSEKREEQQRLLEQKYGSTQVRKVDDSWSKGLTVIRPEEKQNSTSSPKETTKKQQGNKKVVNANELFRIVTREKKGGRGPRNNNRGGNRKGGKGDRGQRKANPTLNFTDKSSFPSLSGN